MNLTLNYIKYPITITTLKQLLHHKNYIIFSNIQYNTFFLTVYYKPEYNTHNLLTSPLELYTLFFRDVTISEFLYIIQCIPRSNFTYMQWELPLTRNL